MRIRPLGDRLVVERLEAEERTKGGIVIPDTAKEKPKEGRVKSVGNGKMDEKGVRHALEVKVHDRILFSSYAGTEVKLDGQEFLIMREEDVLGIVEDGKA